MAEKARPAGDKPPRYGIALNFLYIKTMTLKSYVRILLKHRMAILACIVAITGTLGYCARDLRTDNSIEIWLSKNDKDLAYYKAFLRKFGDEEFLVVAFSAADLFTRARIQEVHTIAEKLKKLDGVVRVASLAGVFKDKVTSSGFIREIKEHQHRPVMNVFKRQVMKDPMYQHTIVSKNGKTTALVATVHCEGPESRRRLVTETGKILGEMLKAREGKVRYHLAGPSVVNAELDRMSKQDMSRLTPFMFLLSVVVLGCLLRKTSGVVIPVLIVGVCMLWITGCFALCGQTMNMISNMLLPLTFIIALSSSIHLVSHYYHEIRHSASGEEAICHTLRHVGVPILMTAITTAIGFVSLATSSIPPVFITGLFMSGCAALTFIIGMTLLPILLSFVPFRKNAHEGITGSFTQKRNSAGNGEQERGFGAVLFSMGRFLARNKGVVLSCALVAGMAFLWGVSRLRVESDLMASFPRDSRIARDNAYIEKHLMGLLPVEIVAETAQGGSLFQPGILSNVVGLQRYFRGVPEVTNSLSVADYILSAQRRVRNGKGPYSSLPDTEKEAADYVRLASVYGDKYVDSLYTKDHTGARVSVRMKQVGSNRYQEVIQAIQEFIRKHLDTTALTWHITGIVPLLINVQDNILWSEVQSFSLAFFLTFISTAVVLKSVRIGLISVIPNLLPITVTLGLMGFTGMKLDAATIMIAGIALGISVDNTIHIFYRFKKEFAVDGDHTLAVCRTLREAGRTALFTSLSAAFGFMVFSFSSFKPVQYFGVLTGVTIMNAIVSDLLITPSCLLLFKPRFRVRLKV